MCLSCFLNRFMGLTPVKEPCMRFDQAAYKGVPPRTSGPAGNLMVENVSKIWKMEQT